MGGAAQIAMRLALQIWQVVFASQTLQVFCLALRKKAQYVVVTNEKKYIFWLEGGYMLTLETMSKSFLFHMILTYFGLHNDVTKVGKNLFQSLVVNPRYNNFLHNFKSSIFKDSNKSLYGIHTHN